MDLRAMLFEDAKELFGEVGDRLRRLSSTHTIRPACTFENLPTTLTDAMVGFVYNVTNNFTTTALFVEGAGKKQKAGTNVEVVDCSTYAAATPAGSENPSTEGWYEVVTNGYKRSTDTEVDATKTYYIRTVSLKYDIRGSFIDFKDIEDKIKAVEGMIAGEFVDTEDYAIGAVVTHEGKLYKFKAAHTAGAFDADEVDETTVVELIQSIEVQGLTTEQKQALIDLLD